MPDLPFQAGDLIESKSFLGGFRGAWFRCKIIKIGMKGGAMSYQLEYLDYPGNKLSWLKLYQRPTKELMVRPQFPTIHHESEKLDVNTITEVIVIVDDVWKVGDLVDWLTDGCYWSGKVTKILGNGKIQVDLLPPPLGEGSSYEALSKDLRPSLDWCPEKGWTVPMPTEDGCGRPCGRILNPPNSGGIANIHATDGAVKVDQPTVTTSSSPSSQNFEDLLECPDRSMEKRKECNTVRNTVEIGEPDNENGRTLFSNGVSSSPIMDASIENLERATRNSEYNDNDECPKKKMRSNSSLCLNSMSSNTIEAAILDLEELVNRIKWLRDVLNLGVPLSASCVSAHCSVPPSPTTTMSLVLHAGNNNKNAYKTLIAAEYSGVQVELVQNFEMGVSNKTPEFLKMNPIGKVPVLETPDGPVFESNAIARYVTRLKADNPLYGSSPIEYAHIEQWIDFSTMEIDANILRWYIPRAGFSVYIAPAEEAAISGLKRALDALNTHLASNTYLVGHSVTLADIIMTCNLLLGFNRIMTKSFTSEFPHVERYYWTMVNQPNFRKIIGQTKQTESVPPVPSVKKPSQPKEPVKPKAKDEAKKEASKEVKKETEKPKEEAGGEDEAPKPKPKNPLDLLPPSKMILDEWKRLYSNTKTNFREVAIKGFWDMYDPEGYSLWFCDYKYNDENMVSFVTLNKVSGFLQRMDLARKYAFGKMLIIGSEPPFKVKGLWLFRGKEVPQFVIDECYDMELYEWTKVDIADNAQKERVNQMIEDHEPFEGEALLDAKCFK